MTKRTAFLTGAGILAFGVAGLVLLVALRPDPPRETPSEAAPLVAAVLPEVQSGHLYVEGNGAVRPTREIDLAAEVPGRVVSVASSFVNGGRFRAGQVLVRIDPTDYQNAVTMAEAAVTQRKVDVLRAREEVAIAREEWARLQRRADGAGTPEADGELGSLVLREPQLRLAEAALKSAEAQLADARARLARTGITAPFDGVVRAKRVDVGQYVAPGQPVARVHNTDEAEIVVPLTSAEAALVPAVWEGQGATVRIPAEVAAEFGGRTYTWDAYVDRVEALDPATRTFNLAVRVPAPYRTDGDRPPLLADAFTTVRIQGRALDAYTVVPEQALREGDVVWLVEAGLLRIRPVEVVQQRDRDVVLADSLDPTVPVVTSPLAVVTDGMPVRVDRGASPTDAALP